MPGPSPPSNGYEIRYPSLVSLTLSELFDMYEDEVTPGRAESTWASARARRIYCGRLNSPM